MWCRALSIYEKNPEISVVAKVEFPIGKKLFHLVVNPGTWPGARPWTWNWYKLQETSMEHDIPFGNSIRENGTTFLDFQLFLGIFQWDEPTKRVPFTPEPEIPEILTKWKAPIVSRLGKPDGAPPLRLPRNTPPRKKNGTHFINWARHRQPS